MNTKINYPPEIPFKINNMQLDIINIDFNDKQIFGKELISLTALEEFDHFELDVGKDIKIQSIVISTAASENAFEIKEFDSEIKNEKLEISLKNKVIENENFSLLIKYSAKGSEPGKGFYFVEHPEYQQYAWTQGESIFSKNWFPCIDHPKLKYPRTVSVIIPENLTVISNGILSIMEENRISDGKKKITWEEIHPNPAYLTSLAIGKYQEISNNQKYKHIPLRYYVPPGRKKDGERTCRRTIDMMQIYEDYFGVKYPYNKYSQVFAKDLDEYQIDGMEHSTCTTLDIDDVLAKEDTPEYRIREDVIAHELSHQWFGDLVTCYDWQDIWLNEGFAAFSEVLFYEKVEKNPLKSLLQYQTYVLDLMDRYIERTKTSKSRNKFRPIVTREYDDPEQLFDYIPYKKGGFIIHMFRMLLGEEDFREGLKLYLSRFKNSTAETDDLRQIFEEVSKKDLQQFFQQWIFTGGHPVLDLIISGNNNKIFLYLNQKQEGEIFSFPLEIKCVFTDDTYDEKKVYVNHRSLNSEFTFTKKISWISVDPYNKILKEYDVYRVDLPLIINQLINGNTLFEKVEAARIIRINYLNNKLVEYPEEIIQALQTSIQSNTHWKVSVESVRTLGSIRFIDEKMNIQVFNVIKNSLNQISDSRVRNEINEQLIHFENIDQFEFAKSIIEDKITTIDEKRINAINIGTKTHEKNIKESISILKKLLLTKSYKNLLARGAIEGLKRMAIDSKDENIIKEIEKIIVDSTKSNDSRLRREATSAMGYLASSHEESKNSIMENLKLLLHDKSIFVRSTACAAICNIFHSTNDKEIISLFNNIIQSDSNDEVKITANECINFVKTHEHIREKPPEIDPKYLSKEIEELENIETYN